MQIEEKVLKVLDEPLTNIEIAQRTGIRHQDVGKALKNLRASGRIVSYGATTDRKHIRLAAAIEILFSEVVKLKKGPLEI